MHTRRQFISGSLAAVTASVVAPAGAAEAVMRGAGHAIPEFESAEAIARELGSHAGEPGAMATNEDFWHTVQQAWTLDRSIVNFNNGGISPSPWVVQEAMRRHYEYTNRVPPPHALWSVLPPQKEALRQRVARQWGVDAEEIAFTRNASEAMQICQLGLDLQPGDEVLSTTHDYPRMLNTFKQRERREGIKLVQFDLPAVSESDDEIVALFERHITPRTKAILMCHVIFLNGQILPVAKICRMARARGVPVLVDGAHALAHMDFSIAELDCDYYGVSLHKWLFAAHGTGLLYVRRDKIKGLWPMMASTEAQENDIRKFEEFGTFPMGNTLAIAEALTFHQGIGPARKEARMRFLKDRWATRLASHPSGRVTMRTSMSPHFSCGIATFNIEGIDHGALREYLWNEHRIFTVSISSAGVVGTRVTPSVYSTLEEVDRFCEVIERVIEKGIPA